MGRQRVPELNPVCGKRLKELIRDEGLTQEQLALEIGVSSQTISKACTGKKLTQNIVDKIIERHPEYNAAWLLGYSEHRYLSDVETAIKEWKDIFAEAVIRNRAELTISLASLYRIAGYPTEYDSEGMTITGRDGNKVSFTLDELQEIEEDIFAFLRYRLQKLVEKGR